MSNKFHKTTQKYLSASYAAGTPKTQVIIYPSKHIPTYARCNLFSLYKQRGKDHSETKIVSGSELAYHESIYNNISLNIIVLA